MEPSREAFGFRVWSGRGTAGAAGILARHRSVSKHPRLHGLKQPQSFSESSWFDEGLRWAQGLSSGSQAVARAAGGWPGSYPVVSGPSLCLLPWASLGSSQHGGTKWQYFLCVVSVSTGPQDGSGFKGTGQTPHHWIRGLPQDRRAPPLKTATSTLWHAKVCWPQPEGEGRWAQVGEFHPCVQGALAARQSVPRRTGSARQAASPSPAG